MNKPFTTLIKEYLAVIIVVVGLILSWGAKQSIDADHEQRITRLEEAKEQNALIVAEINSRLSSIETSLKFIEKQLK